MNDRNIISAALAAIFVGAWLILIWLENNTPKGGGKYGRSVRCEIGL
jgi:predicted metal-binding membrane protein